MQAAAVGLGKRGEGGREDYDVSFPRRECDTGKCDRFTFVCLPVCAYSSTVLIRRRRRRRRERAARCEKIPSVFFFFFLPFSYMICGLALSCVL